MQESSSNRCVRNYLYVNFFQLTSPSVREVAKQHGVIRDWSNSTRGVGVEEEEGCECGGRGCRRKACEWVGAFEIVVVTKHMTHPFHLAQK